MSSRSARGIYVVSSASEVPVSVVTIDHLGLIGGYRGKSRYERVSAIAEDLQAMTKRLGVVSLIATQVSREAGGDGSRKLHLGSSRDSGVYEEVCDYQIGLRRLDRCLALAVLRLGTNLALAVLRAH